MRFTVDPELELFAESVRGALGGWEAPLEPVFGDVAGRPGRGARRAGSPTSAGPSSGRIRRCSARRSPAGSSSAAPSRRSVSSTTRRSAARSRSTAACATARGGSTEGEREPTLDGTGTHPRRRASSAAPDPERLPAWGAVTLAYLAGLADGALDEGGRARALARAVRCAARGASGRAGAPRRCGARPGRARSLRLGRGRAGRRLPGRDARVGRRRLPRGDRARPAGPRRRSASRSRAASTATTGARRACRCGWTRCCATLA